MQKKKRKRATFLIKARELQSPKKKREKKSAFLFY